MPGATKGSMISLIRIRGRPYDSRQLWNAQSSKGQVLQCVALAGALYSVALTIAITFLCEIFGNRPGRMASFSKAEKREDRNRLTHHNVIPVSFRHGDKQNGGFRAFCYILAYTSNEYFFQKPSTLTSHYYKGDMPGFG